MDRSTVLQLLADQVPALSVARVEALGTGWDHDAFLVRDADHRDWVFRFPRRASAVRGLEREIRWLPRIAEALDGLAAVPVIEFVGQPCAAFPRSFVGYRKLPGRPLFDVCADAVPERAVAVVLGERLGRIYRALHDIDPAAVAAGDFADDVGTCRSWYEQVASSRAALLDAVPAALAQACAGFLDHRVLPADDPGVARLVHNDLGSTHVLVDDALGLTGIIDFGDLDRGDPAVDLAYAVPWLGPAGTARLLQSYGAGDAVAARVRVTAVLLAMSWVLECLQVTGEPPQPFHFVWLAMALTAADTNATRPPRTW